MSQRVEPVRDLVPRVGDRLPASLVEAVDPAPVRISVESAVVRPTGSSDAAVVDVGFCLIGSVALTAPIQPLPPTAVITADGAVVGHAEVPAVSAALAIRYAPQTLHRDVSTVTLARAGLSSGELDVVVLLCAQDTFSEAHDPVIFRSPIWHLQVPDRPG